MLATYGLAANATHHQFEAAAIDTGNGFIKFCHKTSEILIPSLIKQISDNDEHEYSVTSRGAFVEYIAGERTDLHNTKWLIGQPAYIEFPDSCVRLSEDRKNKVEYALQALCGALSQTSPQSNISLALAVSIHDADVFGQDLKAALNGSHSVRINGKMVNLNIKTLTLDEGIGAVYYAIRTSGSRDGQTILLDIGYGTAIIAAYSGAKLVKSSRYVHGQGTGKLVQAIADHPITRKHCGGVSGDVHLIRTGIETGFYYGKTSWNFRDVYQSVLIDWVKEVLSPCMKKIDPWLASSDRLIATGGGALMPSMAGLLAKKQISVLANSQMANCLGMLSIAQSKLGV